MCVQTKKIGRAHQSVPQTMSSENWTKLYIILQTLFMFEEKYEL